MWAGSMLGGNHTSRSLSVVSEAVKAAAVPHTQLLDYYLVVRLVLEYAAAWHHSLNKFNSN